MLFRGILFTFLFVFVGISGWAQSVRWQPAGGVLERGQATDLVLIFENCEPEGELRLPQVPNFTWEPPQRGQQTSSSVVNGRVSTTRIVYYSFSILPTGDQPIEIPAFTIETTEGSFGVPAVRYEVREATVGETSIPVSQISQSTIALAANEIWAGEVIDVDYHLEVSGRFRAGLGGEPQWNPAPLAVEEWAEPTRDTLGTGGDTRNRITYSSRGYINQPGRHVIPSIQQLVNIGVPSAGFLSTFRAEQYAITSDSPQLTVRDLPIPAPATFAGAVGQFELTSKVVPESASVGEPITWTLELTGTGNWPDIPGLPTRQASNTFRVVQPDARREIAEGKLFDGSITEDVVLIPTRAGEFPLGPVEWTYFDPALGDYRTISTPVTALTVTPGASPTQTGPVTESSDEPPGGAVPGLLPPTISAAPTPQSPGMIPLEVLVGSESSRRPLATRGLIGVGVLLVSIFPLLWLLLSTQRARRLDPGRPARLARRRLQRILGQIDRAPEAELPDLLTEWQNDTAILWHGTAGTPLRKLFGPEQTWIGLWMDVERALYAEFGKLPADWTTRAQQALANKSVPRFPVFSVLAWRHLFPAWGLIILLVAPANEMRAQGDAAYREGDFVLAEATWREAITTDYNDWIAHHNLALALAQQGRFDEAGAHASVAFVQNPRHPSTRWHLVYTLERSGYSPPIISRFLNPGWEERIAQLASYAEWQRLLLLGLVLGVLALTLVLLAAYGRRLPSWRFLSWTSGLLGVALMAGAGFGLQTWGMMGDPQTAMTWQAGELRSIPTDLNSDQQTTPLAAGSVSRIDKPFLGWRQISFPNGQTGWVRREALVPFWSDQN